MPQFDIVNEIDLQEVDNAVNNTKKTIDTRYDFRGSETEVKLDKSGPKLYVETADTMKLQAVQEMLAQNFSKRGVNPKCLDKKEPEPTTKGRVKQDILFRQGIDKETAKKIVKLIKDTKLKVQAQIQDEQVRVTGKNIDDLQAVIAMLKEAKLDIPLQYVNMKR
jgi:cyclic-di-GMP-binding protein